MNDSTILTILLPLRNISAWSVAFGLLAAWLIKSILFDSRRFFNDKYPPGPPAIPFFGNLFQLTVDAWVPFTKWGKQYGQLLIFLSRCSAETFGLGPVVYLNIAGQPIVVLNTLKAAGDLLDRRSNIYSDRPRYIVYFPCHK